MRAPLLAALVLGASLAGCLGAKPQGAPPLVPYPRIGDVATYDITGAYVELARWENGHSASGQLQFEVAAGGRVLDAARQVVDTYRVTTTLGGAKHADLYVSPRHDAIAQSVYPLSQDQNVVAFDERGFPWLFGASALFGTPLKLGANATIAIPQDLHASGTLPPGTPTALAAGTWTYARDEGGLAVFELQGLPGVAGTLWIKAGQAWPQRAQLTISSPDLAPNVRVDAALPVTMDARLASLRPGATPLPPRESGASFLPDANVARATWDGEAPPDGNASYEPYVLSDAIKDAKLLDKGLQDWLKAASDPRLYRATFKMAAVNETGPLNGTLEPYWLVEWMEKGGKFYTVEVQRVDFPAAPVPGAPAPPSRGVPRVLSSGPADPPADPSHGWFPKDSEPEQLVPLSAAIQVVRSTFGAQGVQVFLRSFATPPGYEYFLDGGWDSKGESGRYTVVYDPGTGLLQEATGPVTARLAP